MSKLYDLLSPHEAVRVKAINVRNVDLNDLTVRELSEIWPLIDRSESEKNLSDSNAGFMSIKALRVLKIRDFAKVSHPSQPPSAVAGLFYPTKTPKLP